MIQIVIVGSMPTGSLVLKIRESEGKVDVEEDKKLKIGFL
jgi:hypothetical protein